MTDLLPAPARIGCDLAVIEERAHFDERPNFARTYVGAVFGGEYRIDHFGVTQLWRAAGDQAAGPRHPPPGEDGHVNGRC